MLRKLTEIFDQLPAMKIGKGEYKPIFRYGTQTRLADDLSLGRKVSKITYPLIYLEMPFEEEEDVSLRFILATMNNRTEMTNEARLFWTYDAVLAPLRDNMVKALLRSGVFKRTDNTPHKRNYLGSKHFNYHLTPDIWDALIYDTEFRYNHDCQVRKIYF